MPSIISLATFGSVFYGLAMGVLAFRMYSMQYVILQGANRFSALAVGGLRAGMGSLLLASLYLAVPALATYGWTVSAFGFLMTAFPFAAGWAAGGYAQVKDAWLKSQSPPLIRIIESVDYALSLIPEPIFSALHTVLTRSHPYIGSVYMAAQLAVFAFMGATVQPLIGFAGLGYSALAYARGHNYLPLFVSKPLEKFNYWVGLFSGIFLKSTVLKVGAILNLGWEFTFNIGMPKVVKHFMGRDSEFLQVAQFTEVVKPQPRIARDVNLDNFKRIYEALPPTREVSTAATAAARAGFLGEELKALLRDFFDQAATVQIPAEELAPLMYEGPARNANAGFLTQIKYAKQDAVQSARVKALYAKYFLPFMSNFFDTRGGTNNYAMTVAHMGWVPTILPPAPEINYEQLLATVEASFAAHRNVEPVLRKKCLDSPKFPGVDHDLYQTAVDLKEERSRLVARRRNDGETVARIAELDALIAENNRSLIAAWKRELSIENETDAVLFRTYVMMRLQQACDVIAAGGDALMDKDVASLAEFQQMGQHVLARCQYLLSTNEPQNIREAQDMLAILAVESGDYCANAAYDVVKALYTQHVVPALIQEIPDMTSEDKLGLFLQDQRQHLFDQIYDFVKNHPDVNKIFPDLDFNDRHTYSSVAKALSVMHLKVKFNAQSDLSNNQVGFLSMLGAQFYGYVISRVMMLLEHGYSPDKVIQSMLDQNAAGDDDPFNSGVCARDWSTAFSDPQVQEYIEDILIATGTESDEARKRIYTMMLYDQGILKCTNPAARAEIEQLMPTARNPAPPQSALMNLANVATTKAYEAGTILFSKAQDVADYVTTPPTAQELRHREIAVGPTWRLDRI